MQWPYYSPIIPLLQHAGELTITLKSELIAGQNVLELEKLPSSSDPPLLVNLPIFYVALMSGQFLSVSFHQWKPTSNYCFATALCKAKLCHHM